MAILANIQEIGKTFRSRPVFSDLSFVIEEGDRVGLIGPNGSGKSTLMKIIAGLEVADSGEVASRKNLRVAYVGQVEDFDQDATVEAILDKCALQVDFEDYQRKASVDSNLKLFEFSDKNLQCKNLSGGWQKRLALAGGMVKQPELLLLDEPTNHLDIETILFIEKLLVESSLTFVVVSHDRAFLESVTNRIIELNPFYPQGFLSVSGSYHQFLELKEERIREQQNLEKSLASKVRREIAWLAQGAKARETKSSHRQKEAESLIEQLSQTKKRNRLDATIDAGFQSSHRKTKELVKIDGMSKSFDGKLIINDLDVLITPKTRLGLVGQNGSGKTTLLKLIVGELEPSHGSVKRADELKVVWFEQARDSLDQTKTLKESFNHDGDYVNYGGRSIHVSTWAKKFAFDVDQLALPVNHLSGGEQARVLIANLMLEVADVLILDEPTNDLDIKTLEVLEDCIEEFPGAVILVSHDRLMLDTVSHEILALSGMGDALYFQGYEQCEPVLEYWSAKRKELAKPSKVGKKPKQSRKVSGLSSPEKRELKELPKTIEKMEEKISGLKEEMNAPSNASQFEKLEALVNEQNDLQKELDQMYERWQALEEKAAQSKG